MRMRLVVLVTLMLLVAAGPASAATKTETSTSGQVTATFTYDYKKSRFGTYDFANLHVTIDRDGVRLVDEPLEDTQCNGCSSWPAGQGAAGTHPINSRDPHCHEEAEGALDP